MAESFRDAVEERAKTFDLAAKLNATVICDTDACAWHAQALRGMAQLLDACLSERAARIGSISLLGFRLTLSRDDS